MSVSYQDELILVFAYLPLRVITRITCILVLGLQIPEILEILWRFIISLAALVITCITGIQLWLYSWDTRDPCDTLEID